MATPCQKHSSSALSPSGLVVIAHDATEQIVTRVTSHHDLVGAMHTAHSVLRLKANAVQVEVHRWESPISDYSDQPLAVVSHDDLPVLCF